MKNSIEINNFDPRQFKNYMTTLHGCFEFKHEPSPSLSSEKTSQNEGSFDNLKDIQTR